ncbi:MAG: GldG family protein [Gammaproteobacteria bacterium]|nr:GldG family protein [Gammaproteobacteria bacterium]NNJ48877.1 GldG family protein [Gammaproteobacteria bacterium]
MKLSDQSRLQLAIQKIIFLLLFISSIGMLAWISNHYSYQFDLTANKRHSLSGNSVDLLNTLDGAVTVHAYTTDDVTRQAINEIIARYQRIKTDFKLRLLNPDIDIEQVQKDGVVMNKPFAFVIYYNGRMEHIDSLSEQSISNALLRLNRRENQQVVFLSGHGERDIDGSDNRAYATLKSQLGDMGFNLQTVNLLEKSLPENTSLLVIAAPSNPYLAGEVEHIERYIDDGGNMLWLSDPGELFGLDKIATAFGLQLHDGIIIDNNQALRQTLDIEHPAIIPVTEYFPHIITNTIRYNTLFPLSRGISPLSNDTTVNNWQAEALFNSTGKSWSEAGGLKEEMVYNASEGDIAGPVTMAVALHRPRSSQINSTQTGQDEATTATGSQRMVVVGDSDFLSNTYIGAGANLNLGLNIFNWLIGDDDFISVEVKPAADTKLILHETQLVIIGFGFFLIIPIVLLVIGFRIWYVRKNR